MKRSMITACALALGVTVGWSEQHTSSSPGSAAQTSQYQPQQMQLFDSSTLEKKRVTDKQGNNLGKLERLLIDGHSGHVRFAVIQADKEWSLNDPEVIVPWGALHISKQPDGQLSLAIDADRNKLMNAPHFDKALVNQLTTGESGQAIYGYWGLNWQDALSHGSVAGTASSSSSAPVSGTTGTASPAVSPSVSGSTVTGATSSGSAGLQSTNPATTTTNPTTTTDGSAGTQAIGNTGTSDTPATTTTPGSTTPSKPGSSTDSPELKRDEANQPDRELGGNETD